jgi:Fe-Mn family superoxide dismutase
MNTLLETYQPRHWPSLSGLKGISDHTLTVHFGLYEGYVKNVNLLNEQLAESKPGQNGRRDDLRFAELKRRLGYEYNGMRLHEYYFDNLTARAKDAPAGRLKERLAGASGDYESWKKDFVAVGGMRGVGWVIAYLDPANGRITNHWIESHMVGHVTGFVPILVMDVWEHAFMLDYPPAERAKYVEAFFENIDWEMCESRLVTPS